LTVGFVGSVNLRKGTPYFFEVARHFDPAKVRFVMVGPVGISAKGIEKKGNVELVGPVPRSAIFSWLEKFDLYFFPSTCEGSAGSVMEAMMTGMPVVCSPNSGSVVRDGTDGRIVRYDDIYGAVAAIRTYIEDAAKRLAGGHEAAMRARSFSVDGYGRKLIDVVAGVRRMR
jgi:glycosyltransferase involved in cell wall biosynthesis